MGWWPVVAAVVMVVGDAYGVASKAQMCARQRLARVASGRRRQTPAPRTKKSPAPAHAKKNQRTVQDLELARRQPDEHLAAHRRLALGATAAFTTATARRRRHDGWKHLPFHRAPRVALQRRGAAERHALEQHLQHLVRHQRAVDKDGAAARHVWVVGARARAHHGCLGAPRRPLREGALVQRRGAAAAGGAQRGAHASARVGGGARNRRAELDVCVRTRVLDIPRIGCDHFRLCLQPCGCQSRAENGRQTTCKTCCCEICTPANPLLLGRVYGPEATRI